MRNKISPIIFYEMSLAPVILEILKVALELNLFTRLSKRELTLEEISDAVGIETRPIGMLLTACAALNLIKNKNGRYSNSKLAQNCLVKKSQFYELSKDYIYQKIGDTSLPWYRLKRAILFNKPILHKDTSKNPWLNESNRNFHDKLHIVREQIMGESLARNFNFSRYRTLLDVGGSSGGHCIAIAKKYPHITAIVFDLPIACKIAKKKVKDAEISNRVKVQEGDFFKDNLPIGADVILFSNILHDWPKETDAILLKKAFAALPKKGAIIIKEFLLNDNKMGPLIAALQAFTVLMGTEAGEQFSGKDIKEMLNKIGFVNIRVRKIDSLHSIVTGVKR